MTKIIIQRQGKTQLELTNRKELFKGNLNEFNSNSWCQLCRMNNKNEPCPVKSSLPTDFIVVFFILGFPQTAMDG